MQLLKSINFLKVDNPINHTLSFSFVLIFLFLNQAFLVRLIKRPLLIRSTSRLSNKKLKKLLLFAACLASNPKKFRGRLIRARQRSVY